MVINWAEGVTQPKVFLKEIVCEPPKRLDTTVPLSKNAPPSTCHCAPALMTAVGLMVTFTDPEIGRYISESPSDIEPSPAIRTVPLGSKVAVCKIRFGSFIVAVADQVPDDGS